MGDPVQVELTSGEKWWRDHYHWFKSQGYILLSRYHPDWIPSWKEPADRLTAEDGQWFWYDSIMAATGPNGEKVIMKRIYASVHPNEVQISEFFGMGPLLQDPRNHCVPLLDVFRLQDEDGAVGVLVMPMLREFNSPRWETVGEIVECWRQIFEGVHFMHDHHTSHRDCTEGNIMLDPTDMYPESFHPVEQDMNADFTGKARYYTRTERPSRYYLIDFGISETFDPANGSPLVYPLKGGDKTAPECTVPDVPCNPFYTDVYYLGNWVTEHFLDRMRGLEFMRPLARDMTKMDPQERPTMDDVMPRLATVIKSLGSWKLRSRPTPRHEFLPVTCFRLVRHLKRRISFIIDGRPAIPRPEARAQTDASANPPRPRTLNEVPHDVSPTVDTPVAPSSAHAPSNSPVDVPLPASPTSS